jgi:hypothetical protein
LSVALRTVEGYAGALALPGHRVSAVVDPEPTRFPEGYGVEATDPQLVEKLHTRQRPT